MTTKNFNAIVYTGNKAIGKDGFITYHKQSNVTRFIGFVGTKYPLWRWITLYDRKTNEKEVIKNV